MQRNPLEDGGGNRVTRYPVHSSLVGHWLQPDPRDEEMTIRNRLVTEQNDDGTFGEIRSGGATPYGVLMADGEKITDYLMDRKKKEEHLHNLKLTAYMIDEKRPKTQERTKQAFPELEKVPEMFHQQTVAIQEALHILLRDGIIRNRDDHDLVLRICREDFALPLWPIWDPVGAFLNNTLPPESWFKIHTERVKKGIFNLTKWNPEHNWGNGELYKAQKKVKIAILRRLYPGLTTKKVN